MDMNFKGALFIIAMVVIGVIVERVFISPMFGLD